MEICRRCKENGRENSFKDNRGLAVHLRTKHGMSLKEYRNMYKQAKPIEKEKKKVVEEVIPTEEHEEHVEPINKPVVETKEEELEKEINVPEATTPEINGLPKIIDYSLSSPNNFVAIFRFESTGNETYKKIIGIGTVLENDKSTVSALIVGDDGLIIPVFMVPEFVGIVEISSKDFGKAVKNGWMKQKKTMKQKTKKAAHRSGLFTRKRKPVTKPVTNEELVEGFSKILARRKR